METNLYPTLSILLSMPKGILLTQLGKYEVNNSKAGALAAITNLNEMLTNACVAVGAVLITIAIVKIIMAMATEDAKGKTDAGMLFGAGIIFVSISGVLQILNIRGVGNVSEAMMGRTMAANIMSVVGKALTYVGVVIFLFAVLSLIIAIAQENSDAYVTSSKMIMVSVAMLFGEGLLNGLRTLVLNGNTDANNWVQVIVEDVIGVASWGALGLVTCGIFKIVMGFRSEDERDRNTGIRFLMAGIGLLGVRGIYAMMGISG